MPLGGGLTLAALATVGSAVAGAQAKSPSFSSSDRGTFRRPGEQNLVADLLAAQAALQLGASGDQIAEDFLIRQVEQNANPANARLFAQQLDALKSVLRQGDSARAAAMIPDINRGLTSAFGRKSNTAPGKISIVNGQIKFDVADPGFQRIVDEANERGGDILRDRTTSLSNLSRITSQVGAFGQGGVQGLVDKNEAFLNRLLDVSLSDAREESIERANQLGISPGRQLGEIAEAGITNRLAISAGQGIERAIALLGGQLGLQGQAIETIKTGLEPSLSTSALSALAGGRSDQLGALNLGLNFALQKSEASAARSKGISNAFQTIGSIGLIGGQISAQNAKDAKKEQEGGVASGGSGSDFFDSGQLQNLLGVA